mmetsp:Transcript_99919/g.287239  ORF Transcript_99919/g.287239 Transcript_99919/m.287239 type:complete len:200 (-) Transcript_99919:209-808(-)
MSPPPRAAGGETAASRPQMDSRQASSLPDTRVATSTMQRSAFSTAAKEGSATTTGGKQSSDIGDHEAHGSIEGALAGKTFEAKAAHAHGSQATRGSTGSSPPTSSISEVEVESWSAHFAPGATAGDQEGRPLLRETSCFATLAARWARSATWFSCSEMAPHKAAARVARRAKWETPPLAPSWTRCSSKLFTIVRTCSTT